MSRIKQINRFLLKIKKRNCRKCRQNTQNSSGCSTQLYIAFALLSVAKYNLANARQYTINVITLTQNILKLSLSLHAISEIDRMATFSLSV